MASAAAAFASGLPVGPVQWRKPHLLSSTRLRACCCPNLFLLASGAGPGCWPRRGGHRRLGRPVPCSGKGRGESGVLDGAREEEALGGGDGVGAVAEEEDGEVSRDLLASGEREEQGKWRPPWEILPRRYRLIGTTSLAFVICNMDKQVGIGEGVSPSAATDLIARSIPLQERSRAVGVVFGGLSVGSVLGLLLAPPIIQNFGWESIFYIFGFLGLLWCLGFEFIEGKSLFDVEGMRGDTSSTLISPTSRYLSGTKPWNASLGELRHSLKDVPWEAFFKSPAIWAMIYAHFCGSWGHYTCLSWLPTYFSEELDLNLTEAAWVSVLPPLGSIVITSVASTLADNLISRGVETTMVRKICQTVAFLSPAVCMTLSSLDFGLPPWEIVAFLTGGLALSSFALSGLYCTHQDISPEYASVLLGITNTVGAVPGIVGVSLTGYLLDSTHSWSLSLFAPSIFFYLTGTIVWLTFASSKPQVFSKRE